MLQTLKMVLPVYVMFTKVDLVAGFVEFFGDLKKSDRAQAWGATFRLDQDKSRAREGVRRRVRHCSVERLHTRGLRRMALERSREQEGEGLPVPARVRGDQAQPLRTFSRPRSSRAATSNQPILRGFYFSSGTQEGKPLDRVVGAMGRAFGLRAAAADEAPEQVESKSYFLRDVFTDDRSSPTRTSPSAPRPSSVESASSASAAAAIAARDRALFLVPTVLSFMNNRALVADTRGSRTEAADVDWRDRATRRQGRSPRRLSASTPSSSTSYHSEGAPHRYRWFMYQGDSSARPDARPVRREPPPGFVLPVKDSLEHKLRDTTGANYLEEYNNLKTYLLLDDKVHLNEVGADNTALSEWEVGRLTHLWAETLRRATPTSARPTSRPSSARTSTFYVDLLKRGERHRRASSTRPLIERTRDILDPRRPGAALLRPVRDGAHRPEVRRGGPNTRDNLKYPPVSLHDLFADRPEVLTKVESSHRERQGKWYEVQGPYTYKGHQQVARARRAAPRRSSARSGSCR